MKGKFELETTRDMKNCINFIRRQGICRVRDISLSQEHYPSQLNNRVLLLGNYWLIVAPLKIDVLYSFKNIRPI